MSILPRKDLKKASVVLRSNPNRTDSWTLMVNGQDISDAVAHDGFHVDFDHGRPRIVITLTSTADVQLDLPDAEVEMRRQG